LMPALTKATMMKAPLTLAMARERLAARPDLLECIAMALPEMVMFNPFRGA